VLDSLRHLSADGGGADGQRPDWPHNRPRHRGQCGTLLRDGCWSSLVGLLAVANIINIGADLGAMANATALVFGGPIQLYLLSFALFCALTEVFTQYKRYVRLLRWLTVALLAYIATLFMVRISWGDVLPRLFIPDFEWNAASLTMVVAIFGTTISPYLFFWQASEEAEDVRERLDRHPLKRAPVEGPEELERIELDTLGGMAYANLIALAIMMTTAATLHRAGITDIETSAQAAAALRPIAGTYATIIFALGIVGTGLLAVPVLAGSVAYALGEALHRLRRPCPETAQGEDFLWSHCRRNLDWGVMNITPITQSRRCTGRRWSTASRRFRSWR
jgi:Mn2+/Fe2+ NRAMP family transporter